ncbi:pentapeptide repeat-containing protein [Paracoccus ravus]|uniref:pentapeptide repeat-containing protein n=1 Tax=Paracoccus ravus TaxID=2447760 RepID=UPI0014302746|nr:pentapeptide repeat-containing protein [Paracoccus ravus]
MDRLIFEKEKNSETGDFIGWKLNQEDLRTYFSAEPVPAEPNGRNFRRADFRWADLWGVVFSDCNFYKANFEGAMLANCHFENSDISAANFRDADLGDADLSRAKGLMPVNLSGARLANARLPEEVKKFERLQRADKAAQSAKATFIALMGACLYCWLTIGATNNADLLLNSQKTALPIINTEIPLQGFYFVAPTLLLSGYIYLHYYLQCMWQDLSSLPAIFPDGEFLDEKIDPWPMRLVLVRHTWFLRHARSLGHEHSYRVVEIIQYSVAVVLAWFVVPVTIIGFWFRYLPTHQQNTWFLLALSLCSLLLLAATFRLAVVTLWERGQGSRLGSDRRLLRALPRIIWVLGAVLLAATSVLMTARTFSG